jgi:hypothetical protein
MFLLLAKIQQNMFYYDKSFFLFFYIFYFYFYERSKGKSERTKRKGRKLHLVSFVFKPSINFTS